MMTNSKWTLNSMRSLIVIAVIASSSGCTPWQLAKKTLFTELNEYPRVTDGRLACKQYAKWAREEWHNYAAASPNSHSSDYISGFIHGFTKYVHGGGNTDPPAVPPRRYWRVGYKNEQGRMAIQDWYNGYAHGTQVAKDKGYRERATLPSSLLLGYNNEVTPAWENGNERRQPSDAPETQGRPLTELNEPTLASPIEDPAVEPLPEGIDRKTPAGEAQGNPFRDDDERLPDTPPVADSETSLDSENAGGVFDSEPPAFPAEPSLPGTTTEPESSEIDGDSDAENVFGDDTSAFNFGAPPTSLQATFEVKQAPPPPPWLASQSPTETGPLFPISNQDELIELPKPTASQVAFTKVVVQPPSDPRRFEDQATFQASLPAELRGTDDGSDNAYSLPNESGQTITAPTRDTQLQPIGSRTPTSNAKITEPTAWKPR